jgi:solute carrier family 39 (zinc transporter), member 1/2/3
MDARKPTFTLIRRPDADPARTPIGQAIGLATHTLYSPGSEFGLVLVGTMNAVSSGLLVFASLIELLAEDFLSDHSWVVMRGRNRVLACLLVLVGAVLMSLVGAWA